MPISTSKATYQGGVVIPRERPTFGIPDEVLVTYVKYGNDQDSEDKDSDEELFERIEPEYRRIREEVVKELYPRFYDKYVADKNSID